jgi:xanthine/CO dehydrogenase XdhC/CoxF family maturation factor
MPFPNRCSSLDALAMTSLSSRLNVRLDTSLELLLERAPADASARVLATVVATAGSTYRKPGARMLIMADGSYLGLLSGGCLEADLKIHAQEVLERGVARAIEYDMRGPDEVLFGVGAGCEGAMRVLLEPAAPGSVAARALTLAARASQLRQPTSLVMVHEAAQPDLGTYAAGPPLPWELIEAGGRAVAEATSTSLDIAAGGRRVRAFVQFLAPPPHLLVCGAGPDAEPVVSAARALGWQVTVVDHRAGYIDGRRFAGAQVVFADADALGSVVDLGRCHAAVVMSHVLDSDAAYLSALAASGGPGYVGLLGPMARRQRLMQKLECATDALMVRLHSPVGLDLGAVIPEAIALSIVSEIHAWLAGH